MKKFYEFKQANENLAELLIYGDITDLKWVETDVTAYDFAKDLSEIDTDLLVRINSYGGQVGQGLAIYNVLKEFGKTHKVITKNDGFACSSASVIFMAGTKRIMNKASLLLIHNAWSGGEGDSNYFRKHADDLDKITQPSIDIYKSVSNLDENTIKEMMNVETWITADEALAYGFATEVEEIGANQSISENYMYNLVLKNKQLAKQIKQQNESEKVDAWTSFFNGGK